MEQANKCENIEEKNGDERSVLVLEVAIHDLVVRASTEI